MIIKDIKIDIAKKSKDRLAICKLRESAICFYCRTQLPKGFYCLGRGQIKVCLDCHEDYLKALKKAIGNHLNLIKEVEEDLKENLEDYTANNTACLI